MAQVMHWHIPGPAHTIHVSINVCSSEHSRTPTVFTRRLSSSLLSPAPDSDVESQPLYVAENPSPAEGARSWRGYELNGPTNTRGLGVFGWSTVATQRFSPTAGNLANPLRHRLRRLGDSWSAPVLLHVERPTRLEPSGFLAKSNWPLGFQSAFRVAFRLAALAQTH